MLKERLKPKLRLQQSRRLTPIICWTISNLHRGSQRQPCRDNQVRKEDGQASSGAQSKRLVNEISKLFYECKLPLIT